MTDAELDAAILGALASGREMTAEDIWRRMSPRKLPLDRVSRRVALLASKRASNFPPPVAVSIECKLPIYRIARR